MDQTLPPRLVARRRTATFVIAAVLLVVCSGASLIWYWWSWRYPYGHDHCCDKQLSMVLYQYAQEHDGKFPTGGATPEASLSLLYPAYDDGWLLRGNTYPLQPAVDLLAADQPLTPETCGWHYVDGLSLRPGGASWPNVALIWAKREVGHNGDRLAGGGHYVKFIDQSGGHIQAADWPRFIADQEKAAAAIRRGEEPIEPWVPSDFFP